MAAGTKLGTAWGVVAAVAGPSIALFAWFVVTWSYRTQKKIITEEVIKRLKVSDMCKLDPTPQAAPTQPTTPSQHTQAAAEEGGVLDAQLLANRASRSHADLARAESFSSAVVISDEPTADNVRVARQLTGRCLRRWDGLLGIRPYSDSLGRRAGIWRDRFDTVRCAVLLRAFSNLNQALQSNPGSFRADRPGQLTTC